MKKKSLHSSVGVVKIIMGKEKAMERSTQFQIRLRLEQILERLSKGRTPPTNIKPHIPLSPIIIRKTQILQERII
jgi:hypothetical protein